MKNSIKMMASVALLAGLTSCNNPATENSTTENTANNGNDLILEKPVRSVLTAEEQKNMTADEIIGRLKKGNENFVNNNLTQRDHSEQRRLSAIGQYPKAIVLSCVDSRVPVEDVFDLGIGDIFVARVAGNIENADIVGSMEFATAVAGSKVIVVLGHTACGAVKHAIDQTDAAGLGMNNLQNLLDEIQPVITATETDLTKSSENTEFLNLVINKNVSKTVEDIKISSPTLNDMAQKGTIKIVGATYNMETGKVTFE